MTNHPNVNPTEPSRGSALAGTAAGVSAPPASLAEMIDRYFKAVDAFNKRQVHGDETDADADCLMEKTVGKAMRAIVGVPARTAADAAAALDWLLVEEVDLSGESGDSAEFRRVVDSVVGAIRGYLSAAAG
jgi:hypothetical protein